LETRAHGRRSKWLEAAAAIEQDIIYLKIAIADSKRSGIPLGLEQENPHLNAVLGIYRTNAASGVPFPHPDDLFCISNLSYGKTQMATATRRNFKASAFERSVAGPSAVLCWREKIKRGIYARINRLECATAYMVVAPLHLFTTR
jgi:hypothetical protein